MSEKTMWVVSGLLYGAASVYLIAGPGSAGEALLTWGFWLLVGFGTVAATVGNALHASDDGESEAHHGAQGRAV